jgi:SAM-dependent methyltransferase
VAGHPPLKVLDVGCGTGFLALRMAELGHRAVGIDLSEEMLAEARRKTEGTGLPVTFQLGDAEAPPPDGAPYDVILERHVIWTLPQPREAVRTWQALLKPGGLLILIEGIFEMSDRTVYPQLEAQLPLYGGRPGEELAMLLESEGFVQTAVRPLMDARFGSKRPRAHASWLLVDVPNVRRLCWAHTRTSRAEGLAPSRAAHRRRECRRLAHSGAEWARGPWYRGKREW